MIPSAGRHLCAIIESEERDPIVADFICRFIRSDSKTLCLLTANSEIQIARLLRDESLNIEFLLASGQLIIAQEGPGKKIDPNCVLNSIDEERKRACEEGYNSLAVLIEMK